jgi:2Fe-2S ferredoxin
MAAIFHMTEFHVGLEDEEPSTGFAGGIYTTVATSRSESDHRILMPTVNYVSSNGITRAIDVPAGMSVMQAALNHRIEGILGECGGNCMCATCHVYVDHVYLGKIPAALPNETFMLSIAAEGPGPNSRLSCQIKMNEDLDGIVVRLPGKQK